MPLWLKGQNVPLLWHSKLMRPPKSSGLLRGNPCVILGPKLGPMCPCLEGPSGEAGRKTVG